jgi:hypothetical protein
MCLLRLDLLKFLVAAARKDTLIKCGWGLIIKLFKRMKLTQTQAQLEISLVRMDAKQ